MIHINPKRKNNIIWLIIPAYNAFTGSYRDEVAAAIDTHGNRIYLSSN
jgi:hypothetical protein